MKSIHFCCGVVLIVLFSRCYSEDVSNLNNLNEDIWSYEESSDHWAQQALQAICDQYDLVTKTGKLKCDDITLTAKFLSQDASFEDKHGIIRREVQEDQVEGSGESPDETETTTLTISDNKATTEVKLSNHIYEVEVTSPKLNVFVDSKTIKNQKVKFSNRTNELESASPKESDVHFNVTNPKSTNDESDLYLNRSSLSVSSEVKEKISDVNSDVHLNVSSSSEDSEVTEKLKSSSGSHNQPNVNSSIEVSKVTEGVKNLTEVEPTKNEDDHQEVLNTVNPVAHEEHKESGTDKKGLENKDQAKIKNNVNTTLKEEHKETDKKDEQKPSIKDTDVDKQNKVKEKEKIEEQQDANTEILLKHPVAAVGVKGGEISEGDKILNHMEVSAEHNVGESTKNVTKASKDSTILIVLFVVVVAIGGAAFTYNKVKKSKSKRSNSSNIVNVKSANDVEQGTELKPLMNNGGTDKKLVNSEEMNEKS